ncbi:MAG TPA: hypothetical protein VF630_15315 [Hymenobacter sp.]|jgi:hypothetical protein
MAQLRPSALEMPTAIAELGARLWQVLMHLWRRIIGIGVETSLTVWQRKRVRLLNGICCVAIAIYIGYVLVFMNSPDWLTFRICLCGIFISLPPFFQPFKINI